MPADQTAADEVAIQALSVAGAFCGVCGFEPGDRGCPDCERCWASYIATLRTVGWAPRGEVIELSEGEQQFLRFALELAADQMATRDGFDADDDTALESLRRLTGGAE